jgi:hypothetical protein
MFRVANFAQHQLTMSYAMRTQSSLAEKHRSDRQRQAGAVYASISSQANELVNVERCGGALHTVQPQHRPGPDTPLHHGILSWHRWWSAPPRCSPS